MPARRSLPDYPSLRYLKVEAKERMRSGEFAALHEAQLAIAREHGLPGRSALCRLVGQQMPAQSWVLPHVRWLISRFRDAGEPGWAPPDDGEARQHFSGAFLDVVPVREFHERAVCSQGEGACFRAGDGHHFVSSDADEHVPDAGDVRIETRGADEPPHRLLGILAHRDVHGSGAERARADGHAVLPRVDFYRGEIARR